MINSNMDHVGGLDFIAMPKIELHAHLSGSISPQCLHEIWEQKIASGELAIKDLDDPLEVMRPEENFDLVTFFPLFGKCTYALINSVETILYSTQSVLQHFQDDGCVYLELRTTPRAVPLAGISREDYVKLILQTINDFNASSPSMVTKLILSIDRKSHTTSEAMAIVNLAISHKFNGVVGVDLCNDPTKGDVRIYQEAFKKAKAAGLWVTIHFAECAPPATETELEDILKMQPDRIGHVIHVPEKVREVIKERKIGLELCLSCNVKLKMMEGNYADHHFDYWRHTGCPITLCTDDVGVVGSPLSNEYGLVSEHFTLEPEEVKKLARSGIETIFGGEKEKERLRKIMW